MIAVGGGATDADCHRYHMVFFFFWADTIVTAIDGRLTNCHLRLCIAHPEMWVINDRTFPRKKAFKFCGVFSGRHSVVDRDQKN